MRFFKRDKSDDDETRTRACPRCAEDVQAAAELCPSCGWDLAEAYQGAPMHAVRDTAGEP